MIRLQKILFPTDFSDSSERAFDLALLLARQFGAELHMLHAVVLHEDDPHDPAHHFPDPAEIQRRLETLADSAMSELRNRRRGTEVEIRQVQPRGIAAAPAILDYASEWDADLIVMGTHGRRGASHLFLGSVAEEVVSHASCPVLSARGAPPEEEPGPLRRILVPVDFSQHSRRSLLVARDLAGQLGAEVQALHVVEQVIQPSYFDQTIDVTKELGVRAAQALDDLVRDVGLERVRQAVVMGQRAVPEIVEFAEEQQSDLVVIATHGLGGWEQFLFGGTAKRVVQQSPVPVLVLKAFGKSLLGTEE